jgi:hypothetical protein
VKAALLTLLSLWKSFRLQRVAGAWLLILVVFLLGLVFAFFVAAPILSPLVYPLF